MVTDARLEAKNRLVVTIVAGIAVGMFGFGFAMVPLYGMLCERFGIGNFLARAVAPGPTTTGPGRTVNVRFMSQVNAGLAAEFGPVDRMAMDVKLGQPNTVKYRFKNLSDAPIEFQAVHSISPDQATPALQKLECFCFTRQRLKPHEERVMPVTFRVEPTLQPELNHLVLGYTLYAIEPDKARIKAGQDKSLSEIEAGT